MLNSLEFMPVFAKAIGRTIINLEDLDFSKIEWVENQGNKTSKNTKVLDLPEFKNISDLIQTYVCEYFYNVLKASPDVKIIITESWLNRTDFGEFHHRHCHPNSILSGVLYLQIEGNSGQIQFINSQYDIIEYSTSDHNIFNGKEYEVTPQKGELLLFPSGVEHAVKKYTGTIPRISLSFNTFIKGIINNTRLSKLEL